MPAVSVLIKPASSACDMDCSYCFYHDEAANRSEGFCGMLCRETAERVVASAMEFASGSCAFMFQGGEPTLAGLDFYRNFLELEKKYAKPGVRVSNSLQTNGYAVTDEWAGFFADNGFLIGLSLDGPAEIHNLNRRDSQGGGTFNTVMRTARLLAKQGVQFNILSVVTGKSARSAEKIYNFFIKQGFRYLQFIPCLEPLCGEGGYAPSVEEYTQFLVRIFDLWYDDLLHGRYVSVRHIDNWLSILSGSEPEACSMCGRCSIQFVIEGDGSVYPCDFYALDEYKLGNVGSTGFEQLAYSEGAQCFIRQSLDVPAQCRQCEIGGLCRNGCRRERSQGINRYCEAYRSFFSQRLDKMYAAVQIIGR